RAGSAVPAHRERARNYGLVSPAVRDRRPPVSPERLGSEADARRGLPAFVLGAIDHRDGTVDDIRIEAVAGELLAGAVELDVGLEDAVELGVRRQRVLVQLLVAELGARRALDDRPRNQLAARTLVEVLRKAE